MDPTTTALIHHEQRVRTRMAARTCPRCERGGGLVFAGLLRGGKLRYRCRYCGAAGAQLAHVPAVVAAPAAIVSAQINVQPSRRAFRGAAQPMANELAATLYEPAHIGGNLCALFHDGRLAGIAVVTSSFCVLSWCEGHPKLRKAGARG